MKDVSLSINPDKLKRARRPIEGVGGQADVSVSAFGTPTEIVCRVERDRDQMVFEFRYVDTEPAGDKPFEHRGIRITQGKFSRKILVITVPLAIGCDTDRLRTLRSAITEALMHRRNKIFHPGTIAGAADELNQEVAEEILEDQDNLRELAPELARS